MIKDHSGSWPLSSAQLTYEMMRRYNGKIIGCCVTHSVKYSESGNYSVFFSDKDVENCINIGYEIYNSNSIISNFINEVENFLQVMENYIDSELSAFKYTSNIELINAYERTINLHLKYLAYYQFTNENFALKARNLFICAIGDHVNKNEIVMCLSATDNRDLYYYKELESWINICDKYMNNENQQELINMLQTHANNYGFLLLGSGTKGKGANYNYYYDKIKNIKINEIEQLKEHYKIITNKSKHANEWASKCRKLLKLDIDIFNLNVNISRVAKLRLKMREISQRFSTTRAKHLMPIINNICLRYLQNENDLRYITNEEIIQIISNDLDLEHLRNEIVKRREATLFEFYNNKITLLTGISAKNKWVTLNCNSKINENASLRLNGTTIYGNGFLTGRILNYTKKLAESRRKNFEDIILVAGTIRPNMIHMCMNAKAIITEEGGFTSHASVLCREMRIPCLVGVQSITKKYKDGELITIDFTAGTVSKSEQTHPTLMNMNITNQNILWLNDLQEGIDYNLGGKTNMLIYIKDITPRTFCINKRAIDSIINNDLLIKKEVMSFVNQLKCEHIAIRSSFCAESAIENSYAGLFKSYINIRTTDEEEIISKIISVALSYNNTSILYNNTKNVNCNNVSVIIQKMVQPEMSGVIITSILKDGYEYMLMEYTLGHLSSIMDGSINPLKTYVKK